MVGIVSGLNNALSAIGANSRFFRSTATNISNSETTGFRAERERFETQTTGGTRFNGLVDGSAAAFLQATGAPGDLSAGGNGFLPTRDPGNLDLLNLLKSAGFAPDSGGVLTDASGRQLLGFPTDASGTVTSASQTISDLVPVRLPAGTSNSPTTRVNFAANLPANANVADSFRTTVTVVDSLGREQLLSVDFTKTGANAFDAAFSLNPAQGTVTAPAGTVALAFDGAGRLASVNGVGTAGSPASVGLTLDFTGSGASAQPVTFGLGQFGGGELGQLAAPFAVAAANADGALPSPITGFDIDSQGVVRATSANGNSRAIFRVPTVTVPAPSELASARGAFTTTSGSGDVTLSSAGQGGFTGIEGGLSRSDVDFARELPNLAIGANVYKAAIKVAQAGDELLDAIIDIKR
jgi:flagellar hook protein FlgE